MAATRDRALDAALDLLGTEGVRALSHARVDSAAKLPPGSTSNWFRTRRALLAGIVNRLAELERADFATADTMLGASDGASSLERLIDGFCAMTAAQAGPLAARTRARYALFLELAPDPELGVPLRRQRLEFERWAEEMVAGAGIPEPQSATRAIMALSDGLMLHRLTVDDSLDMRSALERTIRALSVS